MDQTFAVVHKVFKKKYDPYFKQSRKNHRQFEGVNIIQQVTQRQEQLYSHLQYYLEQLDITNNVEINKTSTSNQATVTLNKTLFQTIVEQNKNIDDCFTWWRPSELLHLQSTIKQLLLILTSRKERRTSAKLTRGCVYIN